MSSPITGSAPPPPPIPQVALAQLPVDWLLQPQSVVGLTFGGQYRATVPLGRGPLTLTFRGECARTGRSVIIKLLPKRAEQTTEQFLWQVREVVSIARLEHPAVQSMVDFGSAADGTAWLVRLSTAGVPLRSVLHQGRISEYRALSIACQIAEGLAAAHSEEVSHGRLKPENIILDESTPSFPRVSLVDFGLTRLGSGTAQTSNEARLLGLRTRLYLPPSWSPTRSAEPNDDVYSLGVVLFEMLAGYPPFAFEASELEGPQRQMPQPFSHWSPPVNVSPATEQLVRRLLNPEAPNSKFTAQQLVDGLSALRATCPPSPSVRSPSALPLEDDEVTRMVPASEPPPPGGRLPYTRPPEIAAFSRPQFDSSPPRASVLPPQPQSYPPPSAQTAPATSVRVSSPPFVQPVPGAGSYPPPTTTASFPPPAIAMSPVSLGLDLDEPESESESEPQGFVAKLKRLFRRSRRPPGF